MNRLFKNRNKNVFTFIAAVVFSVVILSIATQYNVFGLSTIKQESSKANVVNKTVRNTVIASKIVTLPLKDILKQKGISSRVNINIVVSKSSHTLFLYNKGVFLKSYHVDLGSGGTSDKDIQGDKKTPEGSFYITEKTVYNPADYYLGTRWMELSYPNIDAAKRGLNEGIINKNTYSEIINDINNGEIPPQDTPLGGYIGIHGGTIPSFGKDWTWGCVGLTSKDIEDFYSYIRTGTKVTINK